MAFRVNDYLLMITYDILKIKIEQKRKLDNFLFQGEINSKTFKYY